MTPSRSRRYPVAGVVIPVAGHDMKHASLLNPFYLAQESARLASKRTTPSARSTPVCSNCQSDDVICHATAQWSNESQEWELAGTFGQPAHCNSCEAPCAIAWRPLN
jgi:hypothetical protein